jgi:hypothetical protein
MVVVEMMMVMVMVLMSATSNMLGESRRDIIDTNNFAFLVSVVCIGIRIGIRIGFPPSITFQI